MKNLFEIVSHSREERLILIQNFKGKPFFYPREDDFGNCMICKTPLNFSEWKKGNICFNKKCKKEKEKKFRLKKYYNNKPECFYLLSVSLHTAQLRGYTKLKWKNARKHKKLIQT